MEENRVLYDCEGNCILTSTKNDKTKEVAQSQDPSRKSSKRRRLYKTSGSYLICDTPFFMIRFSKSTLLF